LKHDFVKGMTFRLTGCRSWSCTVYWCHMWCYAPK